MLSDWYHANYLDLVYDTMKLNGTTEMIPIRSVPRILPSVSATASRASWAALSVAVALGSRAVPASVSSTCLESRSSSWTPRGRRARDVRA